MTDKAGGGMLSALLFLAEEYDAAQERGEVAGHGGKHGNQFANVDTSNVATAADLGLRRDEIHEARKHRDAVTGFNLLHALNCSIRRKISTTLAEPNSFPSTCESQQCLTSLSS